MLKTIRTLFQAGWRMIPILGGLADCTWKDHLIALKELLLSLIFSTIAFWLTVMVFLAFERNRHTPLGDLAWTTIENGELLVFSISFLGPVLMAALADRQGKKQFPSRDWHVYSVLAIGAVGAVFFTLMKVRNNLGQNIPELINEVSVPFLVHASLYMAGFAVFLRYLTIVYQKNILFADQLIARENQDFANSFAARRAD